MGFLEETPQNNIKIVQKYIIITFHPPLLYLYFIFYKCQQSINKISDAQFAFCMRIDNVYYTFWDV